MHVAATAPLDRIERRRLQRTTGGCNGRPAADTTRQRRGAAIGSVARRIGAALLGTIWRRCSAALRTSPILRQRQRHYQQHEERGRTFEWPTSATPGTGRRHAKFKFHWARIVRRMRARSRCSELRIRTPLARLPWLPNRRIPAALSCPSKNLLSSSLPSVADLGRAPVMSSASIVGSGPNLGLLRR